MHDYFDILGVSPDARAHEIRRAQRRRTVISHPDVRDGDARLAAEGTECPPSRSVGQDVAIDFLEMGPLVDRMQAAFFSEY